ncbi:hypothetical protein FRC06_001851 [Ceratobasidium sp. 370]|nr:hypothetical protein FRC06_001851 [Ceratobasidium sp. 370]
MPELLRLVPNLTLHFGELIASKEEIYAFRFVLGHPVRCRYQATTQIERQICRYFRLAEGRPGITSWELHKRVNWDTLVRYGHFRLASIGDRVRVADLPEQDPIAHDNLYIQYELLPDRNADDDAASDVAMRVIYYSRIRDIFYVEYIRNQAINKQKQYLLIRVEECTTEGLDATLPENPIVPYNRLDTPEVINLGAVQAAVGRIKIGGRNTWAIVDRSWGARTVFNDEDGNPDPDLN